MTAIELPSRLGGNGDVFELDMGNRIITHRQLDVYKKAFDAAMEIYRHSKKFPKEET